MRRLICAIILMNLSVWAWFAPHIYYNFNMEYIPVDKPFVPEYPCVIMEGPGVKLIMSEPGGDITAEYELDEEWEKILEKEETNNESRN